MLNDGLVHVSKFWASDFCALGRLRILLGLKTCFAAYGAFLLMFSGY